MTHASKHTLSRNGSRSDLTVEKIDWMLDDETVFRRAYEARDFARFSAHFLTPHPHGHLETTARNQISYQFSELLNDSDEKDKYRNSFISFSNNRGVLCHATHSSSRL